MSVAQLVIFDPEADRPCSGPCGRLAEQVREALGQGAVEVTTFQRLPEGAFRTPDLVILRAPSQGAFAERLAALRRRWPWVAVLGVPCAGMAGLCELRDLVEEGLDDFLCCPFTGIDLAARVHRLLPQRAQGGDRGGWVRDPQLAMLIGESPAFLAAVARVPRVAGSEATALVSGETGVGKGMFARAIHDSGPRRDRPFVQVNCGAIPDDLFENELFGHARGAYTDASTSEKGLLAAAEGGTIFLDEVDTLATTAQAKLLRFLQDREYRPLGTSKALTADVRVIAATHASLRERVAAHRFRQDLFHRLNILCIDVPPLRERMSDIPLLVRHFLARYADQYGRSEIKLTRAALRKLLAYRWPGNVRELEGLLHRAVVFTGSGLLDADHIELPAEASAAPKENGSLRGVKDQALFARLTQLLAEHGGNVSRAALASGSDRRTLQRLIRKYGIARADFRDAG
jgi:DNA-binding NtrC family response regulator